MGNSTWCPSRSSSATTALPVSGNIVSVRQVTKRPIRMPRTLPDGFRRHASAAPMRADYYPDVATSRQESLPEDTVDPQTVDQNYAQLQQQGQQTASLIQTLAGKLQAAAAAGDMNAREWMLDL